MAKQRQFKMEWYDTWEEKLVSEIVNARNDRHASMIVEDKYPASRYEFEGYEEVTLNRKGKRAKMR